VFTSITPVSHPKQELSIMLDKISMPDPSWFYYEQYIELHKMKVLIEALIAEMSRHEKEEYAVREKISKLYKKIDEMLKDVNL
jgi:hypothetical protein